MWRVHSSKSMRHAKTVCCFRKASGKWVCDWGRLRCWKSYTTVRAGYSNASKEELLFAFQMFDADGNGVIDKDELTLTMGRLAKAGRMRQPTPKQIDVMMSQADKDGDGEIDFDEFIDLIGRCELHPGICRRCEDSQFSSLSGRLRESKTRSEKAVHIAFATVSGLAPLQAALAICGATVLFSVSDSRNKETVAIGMSVGAVVVASLAATISCGGRPALRWGFVLYALVQLASLVGTIVLLLANAEATDDECTLGDGRGTSEGCPELVTESMRVAAAESACNSTAVCEWSTKCTFETSQLACHAVTPLGLCAFNDASARCRLADPAAAVSAVHGARPSPQHKRFLLCG